MNQGVTDVLLRTHCKVSSATLTLTSGTEDYTLDTNILRIIDMFVTSDLQDYAMERKTVAEILALRRSVASNTSPSRYYAVAGSNLLMVYPTPSSADVVTMYYVPRPATLSTGSDTPSEIPSEFHKLVEWYALSEAADYDDDGSSNVGANYLARYEKGIAEAKAAISRKGGRPARAIPGRRPRIGPSVPSQDIG